MILTVTLNPSLDRTMVVPNFSAGFRNRAIDTVVFPGGKGINVARAARILGRPVIATGFLGGRRGDQVLAELNSEGILNDFVRIQDESRLTMAVVDPATNSVTEITEAGPEIGPEEITLMNEKLEYLGKVADIAVLAGSVPRGLDDDCYVQMIERLQRLGVKTFFYTYGDPLRRGIKAGPDYVFPKLIEAEKVIGYEFTSLNDRIQAARRMRDMGAGSVVITFRYGCVAELTEGGSSRTYVGKMPEVAAVSPLGWGDALVGGYVVRLLEGAEPVECLRFGLGCAAASLVQYGAGVFLPEDAQELAGGVELEEVSAES
jgi:1-phosphofructokinase family hexose kinase